MPPGSWPTWQRTLARKVDAYVPVADELEQFCVAQGVSAPAIFRVRLFLEELVLNLIDHAVGSVSDRINVRIDIEPERIVLVLEDDSDPFDPRSAPALDTNRPLEARSPRGMGIHLVRSLSDDVAYERVNGRNQLRVVLAR